MTKFFLADGTSSKGLATEEAYSELRERSWAAVGCAARQRRIFKLDCRFEGCDSEIEVGQPLPSGDDIVVAILDHGRDEPYAVHTRNPIDGLTMVARPVYGVTDFA
jgi:hypothetical protein